MAVSFHLLGTNGFLVKAKKKEKKRVKEVPLGAMVIVRTSKNEVEHFTLLFGRSVKKIEPKRRAALETR